MQLSQNEAERRKKILSGRPFSILMSVALPLVFYNSLSQIFQLIDTLIASNMSALVVSTVSFVSQIETMITAAASGLSLGGGILIARSYGEGNLQKTREQISTLFFLSLAIGFFLLSILIPFSRQFLIFLRMPKDLLKIGTKYFVIAILGTIFQFMNTVYLAVEKSRGNTKIIFVCNTLVLIIKTSLNFLTISLMKRGFFSADTASLLLPTATAFAHAFLTFVAIFNLSSKKNPFRLGISHCRFRRYILRPIFALSVPVFIEKFVFAFGKVIVNSMCASYGTTVVGALGVSNRISGISTNPTNGFQEAESSLISNNVGAKQIRRALSFFYRTFLVNVIFSTSFFIVTSFFQNSIIALFAKGNEDFAREINIIYNLEKWDIILLSINSSVMGLLYGFGKTRISLVINIMRLFAFRIPALFFMMHFTNLGVVATGIAMLISNGLTGILAGTIAVIFVRKMKKELQ